MVCKRLVQRAAARRCLRAAVRHRGRRLLRTTAHDRWLSGLLRNREVKVNRLFLTNMTDTVIAGGHRERTSAGTQRDARRLLPAHAGFYTNTHTHTHTHTHTFLDSLSGHARAPGARARTLIRTLSKLCLYSFNEACTHMQRCWAPVPEHRPEFVTVLPILESIKAQHPVPPSPYLTASPSPIKQNGFDQPQVRTCKCQIFALCMLICGGFVG